MANAYTPIEDRFWSRVVKAGPDDCWVWTGATWPFGYGALSRNGKQVAAHVYAWERVNGPKPAGMYICHRCDNPPCVNIAHLFLGTPTDNWHDCVRKGRSRVFQYSGEKNSNAHHSDAKVAEVFAALEQGLPIRAIARLTGVPASTVRDYRNGRTRAAVRAVADNQRKDHPNATA